MDKKSQYYNLVQERKECRKCQSLGLVNQSQTAFDTDEIGGWSLWANHLDAKIVIVGQDFSNQAIFKRDKGMPEPRQLDEQATPGAYSTITNYYLRELVRELGFDIGPPSATSTAPVFLTNAILCLKAGSMHSSVDNCCFSYCGSSFLKPLLGIIQPAAVITLGQQATKAVLQTYQKLDYLKLSMLELLRRSPIPLTGNLLLFPVYHPSRRGQSNRKMAEGSTVPGLELQRSDWQRIAKWLRENRWL